MTAALFSQRHAMVCRRNYLRDIGYADAAWGAVSAQTFLETTNGHVCNRKICT